MAKEKALRFNTGKLKLELIPPEFIEELGKVFTKGAVKYADDNWKNSINTEDHNQFVRDRLGSMKRHLLSYEQGQLFDTEVVEGAEKMITSHLGHIAWNALVIMYYEFKKRNGSTEKVN